MSGLVVLATVAALGVSLPRWLRVSQREHYLAGSASRFAVRWWRVGVNPALAGAALGAVVIAVRYPVAVLVAAAVAALGPVGLSWRGRTSRLAWTERMRRLAVVAAVMAGVVAVVGLWAPWWAAVAALLAPVAVDVAAMVMAPVERRLADRWVRRAAAGLERSGARVVAITGSYGKTTTKFATAHLLAGVTSCVASPASFNNRMGLARAINEHLSPGTGVFVAEMGTYGPGEIEELTGWIAPEVAVITAIGPVHLERMRSEERIADAKREILGRASVGVLMVDSPHLARIADEEEGRIRVIRVSAHDPGADVHASPSGEVRVGGEPIGTFDPTLIHPQNVACALGAVIGLGYDPHRVADRLSDIPATPHRLTSIRSESGFVILDDTFNSNPAGARAALAALARHGDGRRVVVTPGMVELGGRQHSENAAFAAAAVAVADTLVVVGRTNRRALLEGAESRPEAAVIVVPTREAAVSWVRDGLGPDDAVLYENDLPDHYP